MISRLLNVSAVNFTMQMCQGALKAGVWINDVNSCVVSL